jgi:acyl-CoA synthetase (AMP-forming)/AMP-acid ligase II
MHLALREHYEHEGTRPPPGRLRFFRSSSAPLPPSAITALETLFEAPLIETYGLTETASMVCANPLPRAPRKPGSVGIAVWSEIRVVRPAGEDCGPDEVGEIAIRGPSVITAYADNAAADSFLDGWLLTGDIGRLDADGYLFIVGRAKEVIKRGGLSVYPAEVDDALSAIPAVAEAVTFAVPHPTLGEDVVAAVVGRAGVAVDGTALRAEVAHRLSTYKVPSVILVVPSIPKNETGKIVRRQVASALAEALAPQGEPPAGEIERLLLATWRAVLGRDDIGVTDNVFLHGADPLRGARAAERIAASGVWAPMLKDLLAAPTVREQAARARPG